MEESVRAQGAGGKRLPCVALALIVIVTAFVRPGDTSWINDEPKLLKLALLYNQGHFAEIGFRVPFTSATLGVFGLVGTRGARYGPAPIWLYQIFLGITHDPVVMVMMRAVIFSSVTALALAWLLRTLNWNPWLAVVTMLSPWLWHYSRQIWDNSFCIPLSALLVAGYADYLKRNRLWAMGVAAAAAGLLPLTHLMSLALLAPVGLHLVLRRANWPRGVGVAAVVFTAVEIPAWPYWDWLANNYSPAIEPGRSPYAGYFYPLLGGHHLSAVGLSNLLGRKWVYGLPGVWPYLILVAAYFSGIAYVAVWIGIVRAAREGRRVVRRMNASLADHLSLIALGTLAVQVWMDGTQRVYGGPHYFNATWIAYAILGYRTFQMLPAKWGKCVLWAYGGSLGFVLVSVMVLIGRNGGAQGLGWGPALSQQVAVVREIGNTPLEGGGAQSQAVANWRVCPWEYDYLKELLVDPAEPPRAGVVAIVKDRDQWAGDAQIVVEFAPQ